MRVHDPLGQPSRARRVGQHHQLVRVDGSSPLGKVGIGDVFAPIQQLLPRGGAVKLLSHQHDRAQMSRGLDLGPGFGEQ